MNTNTITKPRLDITVKTGVLKNTMVTSIVLMLKRYRPILGSKLGCFHKSGAGNEEDTAEDRSRFLA